MTQEQINELRTLDHQDFIETHISWVIVCGAFVYKIKRPVQYSFLDFSTLEKRKFYCEREVALNRRLADDIYLGVECIRERQGTIQIGGEEGELLDYAVKMCRMDSDREMDILLTNNKVQDSDILHLAEKIARFHKRAGIVFEKDVFDVQMKFADLAAESDYLAEYLGEQNRILIKHAIETSAKFIRRNEDLLVARLKDGFFRDCHGDLHLGNIFLLSSPQPFDCIEFNDEYRQIDILDEIAFLCMDLEVFGRPDLEVLFLKCYSKVFPILQSETEQMLFLYYKAYRANIRAKIHSLRALDAVDENKRMTALARVSKYLSQMKKCLELL